MRVCFPRLGAPAVPTVAGVPAPDARGALGLPPLFVLPHPDRPQVVSGEQDELPLARGAHFVHGSVRLVSCAALQPTVSCVPRLT